MAANVQVRGGKQNYGSLPPKRIHILIPGNVTLLLYSLRDFTDVIQVTNWLDRDWSNGIT